MDSFVTCGVCGLKLGQINYAHLRLHNMTTQTYKSQFPDLKLRSEVCNYKNSVEVKKAKSTPEAYAKASKALSLAWSNSELRERASNSAKQRWAKPDVRLVQSGVMLHVWEDLAYHTKMSEIMLVAMSSSLVRSRISKGVLDAYVSGRFQTTKSSGRGKGAWYNGIYMRSTWERNFARILDQLFHVLYQYEPKVFVLSDGRTYRPDFYLPSLGIWVEVKGWLDKVFLQKWDVFTSMVEGCALLIGPEQYKVLELVCRSFVVGWEP